MFDFLSINDFQSALVVVGGYAIVYMFFLQAYLRGINPKLRQQVIAALILFVIVHAILVLTNMDDGLPIIGDMSTREILHVHMFAAVAVGSLLHSSNYYNMLG
jgi:hypothetical protein